MVTNGAQDGEGWTVCSRTDVTSFCVFVVWALIWSVKGIRVCRKTELRDDVVHGLPQLSTTFSWGGVGAKNTVSLPISHISGGPE